MQLIPTLIDTAETGHEGPDFSSSFLNALRQIPTDNRHVSFW